MLVPVCAFIAACSLYYAARKATILRLTSLNVRSLTRHMFVFFFYRDFFKQKCQLQTGKVAYFPLCMQPFHGHLSTENQEKGLMVRVSGIELVIHLF